MSANTLATLNGNFKEVYADKYKDLVPDGVILMKEIPMVPSHKRLGRTYNQPIVLGQETGFSYGGTETEPFDLNDAEPMQSKEASIVSYEFVLRTAISIGAVSRSMSDKNAFEKATKLVVANMVRSFAKRLEVILLYGQTDIGVISAVGSVIGSTLVVTLSAASWAPGIWAGSVNMKVSVWDANNSFADLDTDGFKVTAIDLVTRQITLTGDATALGNVDTSDVLTHFGAGYFGNAGGSREFAGLHKIMTNTGLLHGINAANYDLWKSTQFNVAGQLSFPKIQDAIALAMARGLEEDVTIHVNPSVWSDLITDEAAQRRVDSSYDSKKAEKGSQSICFYSQNGKITIRPNIYVKESLAFCVLDPAKDCLMKVGSSEVTFDMPGFEGEFFKLLADKNAYELRAYADIALFTWCPNKLILLYGITT
jgi:hypothetical protein